MRGVEQLIAVPVLGVGVDAEVDAARPAPAARRTMRQELIEVVALDDRVEADAVDAARAHSVDASKMRAVRPGMPRARVVALVEVVEGDVELVDAGLPQRPRARSAVSIAAVRDQRMYLSRTAADTAATSASRSRRISGSPPVNVIISGIEEARRGGETRQLVLPGARVGLPVVAEAAPRVAAERDLEVDEHRHPPAEARRICR